MPNRVELIFVSLAFLYMDIIIKREDDGPIFNRGVRVGRYNVGVPLVSRLRAALKAAYLAGESPAPGIAYLPG